MKIRPARPEEAAALSELCFRSKAYWGYDDAFMDACREELMVNPSEIERRRVTVAELNGTIVGLYALDDDPPTGDVGLFFVSPEAIGTGVGRVLWDAMIARAREFGFKSLSIDADPNAEGFYLRMGAVRVGEAPSGSIPGRVLPHLGFRL